MTRPTFATLDLNAPFADDRTDTLLNEKGKRPGTVSRLLFTSVIVERPESLDAIEFLFSGKEDEPCMRECTRSHMTEIQGAI